MSSDRKPVSIRDVLLVAATLAAILGANVGVVRALDVALDAVHDGQGETVALIR